MIRKLSNNTSVVVVVLIGFGYLAWTYWVDPERASDQFIPVLSIMGVLARLLYQVDAAATQATAAVAVAQESVEASQVNTTRLVQIDSKVDTAVEKVDTVAVKGDATYGLVDGQMTDFKQMYAEFAALKAELAAERGRAAGIAEGREQRTQESAPSVSPPPSPSDAAALGAAEAVRAVEPGASAGEIADAAAQGAADATEAKP